jgi:hypothetical protein
MNRDVTIEDSGGRRYSARTVFKHSIEFLNKHFFSTIENRSLGIEKKHVQWVLTVPAIWNEPAKQFMREAALEVNHYILKVHGNLLIYFPPFHLRTFFKFQAGIPSDRLQLALEPEAASLFCKYVPAEKQTDEDGLNMKIVPFSIGTRYMILDLGGKNFTQYHSKEKKGLCLLHIFGVLYIQIGGTGDVTVHEVVDEDSLKELNVASGGAWGGTNVDRAYFNMLKSIFGEEVLKKFKTERRTDMLEFQRDFEMKKRHIREKVGQNTRPVIISIPVQLSEFIKEMKGITLQDAVADSDFADKIKIKPGNKLAINREVMEALFDDPRKEIIGHVRNILENQDAENRISAILMVGGFSTSNIIVDAVRQAFPNLRVVVPPEPDLAVVKGAVLYGHAPLTISSRVCKYTYGVAVYVDFNDEIHPPEKKVEIDEDNRKEVLCKDVFSKFVEAGESVSVNKSFDKIYDVTKPHSPMSLQIFATPEKNPLFTTDKHCQMLGTITISPPHEGWKKGAKIKVSMEFGGTEFKVHASDDQNPNTLYSTNFDFLL